jgi:hypothetical protein
MVDTKVNAMKKIIVVITASNAWRVVAPDRLARFVGAALIGVR